MLEALSDLSNSMKGRGLRISIRKSVKFEEGLGSPSVMRLLTRFTSPSSFPVSGP